MTEVSIVIPILNEEECIDELLKRLTSALAGKHYEILFVDDGSTDQSLAQLNKAAEQDSRIKLIELAYNHGKSYSLTAGIKAASGKKIVMMDPDLQDPPEKIGEFLTKLDQGSDVVYGIRDKKKDSFFNSVFSACFWSFLDWMTGLKIPKGLAVMRAFNQEFQKRFLLYSESNRFLEGIFFRIGMRQSTLTIPHRERYRGVSKFNFRRKVDLALTAVLDFSDLPLRAGIKVGLLITLLGLLCALWIIVRALFFVEYQMGWPSLFTFLLISLGLQLSFLGIIGIYVGRTYQEAKSRPIYETRRTVNL